MLESLLEYPRPLLRRSPALEYFEVREITSSFEFERLAGEWLRLLRRCPPVTPFQSPAWILSWWRHFRAGRLWALALYHRDVLAGLAPLYILQSPGETRRTVLFIGTGITDYQDILVEPRVAMDGTELLLRHLERQHSWWDDCDFQELREHSPLLSARYPVGLGARVSPFSVCPVVSLPHSMSQYLAGLPSVHRRKVRLGQRKMENLGHLYLELANENTLEEFLDDLFRLHHARWKERGQSGVLSDSEVQAFHREAARRFQESGCLRLYRLRLDRATVAVVYTLVKDGRVYSYLGGFDPELERFSPGQVILLMVIEDAIRSGYKEFDFLRGGEQYKYQWNAVDRMNRRLELHAPGAFKTS